jgi:hypothetical protein
VEAAAGQLDSGFAQTPLYARIAESYREGAGLLLWVDLATDADCRFPGRAISPPNRSRRGQMVASATLGFDGPRTGMAAQLAEPSPMGSLDYVSPDALAVLGFVLKDPGSHGGRRAGDYPGVVRGRAAGTGRRAPAKGIQRA